MQTTLLSTKTSAPSIRPYGPTQSERYVGCEAAGEEYSPDAAGEQYPREATHKQAPKNQSSFRPAVSGVIAIATKETTPVPITYQAGPKLDPVTLTSQVAMNCENPPKIDTPKP